jgi:hypothetical protein
VLHAYTAYYFLDDVFSLVGKWHPDRFQTRHEQSHATEMFRKGMCVLEPITHAYINIEDLFGSFGATFGSLDQHWCLLMLFAVSDAYVLLKER